MIKRMISAFLLIAMFIAIIIASCYFPVIMKIAVAALCALALYEVLVVTKYIESKFLILISLAFAIAIPLLPEFQKAGFTSGIFIFAMILFITLIAAYKSFKLEHLSVVFIMSVIIPFFFSTIIYSWEEDFNVYYLFAIFLAAWGTDTGGYVFGKLFGRVKMTPEISPKKTFEGAIGGLIASVCLLICVGFAAQVIEGASVNYVLLCVFAVVGGIMGIMGDLTASIIKRNFSVKDFGSLIPGHGGIMDRFDSVLFVAPTLFLFITLGQKAYEAFGITWLQFFIR